MSNEIEYRYVRGKGWVAGYKDLQPIDVDKLRYILSNLPTTRFEMTARRWYEYATRR